MSHIGMIIEERSRDIGDFLVGRLIPFRKKRMIGPFIFIDHMGPTPLGPSKYMDVDQHPHIGLATLTYMLEGELVHEDSMGTYQRITPGSVNWMIAGKGVSHTERTPVDLRDGKKFMAHGYQIWVALPKAKEGMAPEFHHMPADTLPKWQDGPAQFILVAGEGYGKKSPVPVHSDLFMVEIRNTEAYELDTKGHLQGEIGICIVEGAIEACGQNINSGNILVSKVEDGCKVILKPNSHILLFGGAPLPEERHIYWNFVASDPAFIEKAKKAWIKKDFPMMANDSSYVPLPGS